MFSASDEKFMQAAIEQAKQIKLAQDVNPAVGAVLVNSAGEIVATGFHRGSGTPHAEVDALTKVSDASDLTLYVTLEPCNSTGATGPCSESIVQAGIKKVVIGKLDDNPKMSGGVEYLTAHGVTVTSGLLENDCAALNESWHFAHRNNRPWIIWKVATSLDGFIAASDGTSQWITSEEARDYVQDLRASVGAIVTGTGTVLADDPQLTVRKIKLAKEPLRVVIGKREIPPTAKIRTGAVPAVQLTSDIDSALKTLWTDYGIHKVLVEAGPGLSSALWANSLVDEVFWFQAPLILGAGKHAIGDFGVTTLSAGPRFSDYELNRVGLDLLIHFRTN